MRRRTARPVRLEIRDLVVAARNACDTDMKQLDALDRHLCYGWDINKISGYDGKPKVIFLQMKRTNGTYAIVCIMPEGRVERPVGNNKTLRVSLPR